MHEFRGRLVAGYRDPCRADPAVGQLVEGAKRRQVAGVVTEITCGADRGAHLAMTVPLSVRTGGRSSTDLRPARTTSPVATAISRARAVTWARAPGWRDSAPDRKACRLHR